MQRGAQIMRRDLGVTSALKTFKSVYFKWFGAFFGHPFLATIFLPERSHAAWRSFLDRDFFFLLTWWSYVGPMRASKTFIKPIHFYIF